MVRVAIGLAASCVVFIAACGGDDSRAAGDAGSDGGVVLVDATSPRDATSMVDAPVTTGCARFAYIASGSACPQTGCPAFACACPNGFPASITSCQPDGCIVGGDCTQVCAADLGEAVQCTSTYSVPGKDASAPPVDASTPRDASAPVDASSPKDACTPTTCAIFGAQCGAISDGCGSALNCGTCAAPEYCGGGGIAYMCGCMASGAPGPFGPRMAENVSVIGNRAWENASGVLMSDGNAADVSALIGGDVTNYLVATDFGIALPPNANVAGIQVDILRHTLSGTDISDNAVRLVNGASITPTDRSSSQPWTTTSSYATYGGPTDTWGRTWTAAEVTSPNFGVALSAKYLSFAGNDWPYVDYMRVTVYFTATCQ